MSGQQRFRIGTNSADAPKHSCLQLRPPKSYFRHNRHYVPSPFVLFAPGASSTNVSRRSLPGIVPGRSDATPKEIDPRLAEHKHLN